MRAWVATAALALASIPSEAASVGVAVYKHADVQSSTLSLAKTLVSDIYYRVQVDVVWRDQTPAVEQQSHLELTLIVLSRPFADRHSPDGEMGIATMTAAGPGQIAYVFGDRVSAMADKFRVDPVKMLALAIAHELGHLLLPVGGHSIDGLMRGEWRDADLRALNRGMIGLTPEQGRLIRNRLAMNTRVPATAGQATATSVPSRRGSSRRCAGSTGSGRD